MVRTDLRTILPSEVKEVYIKGRVFDFPVLAAWNKIIETAEDTFVVFVKNEEFVFPRSRLILNYKGGQNA